MNSRTLTLYRWRKKLLVLVATLPLLQAAGTCDLLGISGALGQEFGSNLAFGIFGAVVRGTQSTLLQFFPGADLLNLLLGGNTTPFYTG